MSGERVSRRKFLKIGIGAAVAAAAAGAGAWWYYKTTYVPAKEKVPPAKPIVIGVPEPLADPLSDHHMHCITLAVEEINKAGGVEVGGVKRPLKMEVVDTRDLEAGVPIAECLLAVEKLIVERGADIIIGGPWRSEAGLATLDLVAKYKMPYIFTDGVWTPVWPKRVEENYAKFKYAFKYSGDAVLHMIEFGEILSSLKEKYGFHKIYLAVQDVEHARKAATAFDKKIAPKIGWDVIGIDLYPTGARDFSKTLEICKREKVHVLFCVMDMPEEFILVKQWYALKVPSLGVDYASGLIEDPMAWRELGAKLDYWLVNVTFAANAEADPAKMTPEYKRFYDAHVKRWGFGPEGLGSAPSYDSVYLAKYIIETIDAVPADAPEDFVREMERVSMRGAGGTIKFNKKNHFIIRDKDPAKGAVPGWFQWREGKRPIVYPETVALKPLELPPWLKPAKS